MAKHDPVIRELARVATGGYVTPEAASAALREAGVEEADFVALAGTSSTVVSEFENRQTKQTRNPMVVSEDIFESEATGHDDAKDTQTVPVPQGTGSNDPAVNIGATGEEPFATDEGINASGQVVDAGEYREDEDADTGADKKTTKAKAKV